VKILKKTMHTYILELKVAIAIAWWVQTGNVALKNKVHYCITTSSRCFWPCWQPQHFHWTSTCSISVYSIHLQPLTTVCPRTTKCGKTTLFHLIRRRRRRRTHRLDFCIARTTTTTTVLQSSFAAAAVALSTVNGFSSLLKGAAAVATVACQSASRKLCPRTKAPPR